MGFSLAINGRAISPYVRLQNDDGFDPAAGGYSEPQFAGSSAFRDGQSWAGDANANRELTVPLILSASSEDALHSLIRDINSELVAGSQVEFRSSGASASSYFTLERGRLDVQYQFWVTSHNRVRATLILWSAPHAHTATSRVVASFGPGAAPSYIATSSLLQFPATGILGDVDAPAQLQVRVGSRVASGGRLIAYGAHRSASYNALFVPSDGRFEAQASSVATGASGAIASLMYAIPVSPTGASGIAGRIYLTPPGGHTGRHRLFGAFRSGLDRPLTLWARDRFGAPLGPTTAASQTDANKWGLVDLGEINVPARASGQEPVPTQYVELISGGASGAAVIASPALKAQGLFLVPLDQPGLMLTQGAAGGVLYQDEFGRFGLGDMLQNQGQAIPGPGVWRRDGGYLAGQTAEGGFVGPVTSLEVPAFGATGLYNLATGTLSNDVLMEARVRLFGPPLGVTTVGATAVASGASIELYPKMQTPTSGFAVRLVYGPVAQHHIAIMDYAAAGPTARASAALGASTASGLYLGQDFRLAVDVQGGAVRAWIATGSPDAALISASHGNFTQAGWPAVKLQNGAATAFNSNTLYSGQWLDSVKVTELGPSAPDIAAREWFRFESYPEPRAIQGNASIFVADRAADFRGVHPKLPAVGSPGASGPARFVVVAGEVDDFVGNDVMDVSVVVRESFRYLR